MLHTASREKGQIYVPAVNLLLGAVVEFGSSDALGGAYGIAVSMLMAITTVMAALVARPMGTQSGARHCGQWIFPHDRRDLCRRQRNKARPRRLVSNAARGRRRLPDTDMAQGNQLLEQQRSRLQQRSDEFVEWFLESRRSGCRKRRRS